MADSAVRPVERHVREALLGVVPPAVHVFEASLGGDRLGGLEPRAGVREEADPGEDLIRLDDDLVGAVDPLDPRRTISEPRIEAGLPPSTPRTTPSGSAGRPRWTTTTS